MYWFLPNETGHYGSNGFAIDTINRNARTASKHDSRWDFQDYCRSTLRQWYTLMLLTSPPSNVWWFIYSHCYNKFKGQRFICKLGFSPLASIYIYWNFRAKRTIMLCSLSCYDPFSCTPSIQTVRYVLRCLLPFDVALCDRNHFCR